MMTLMVVIEELEGGWYQGTINGYSEIICSERTIPELLESLADIARLFGLDHTHDWGYPIHEKICIS